MPVDSLIKLPDDIAFETAAAMTMRGLDRRRTCCDRIARVKAGDTVLLHAAAGGVGLIVCQWAKLLGITVIGTRLDRREGRDRPRPRLRAHDRLHPRGRRDAGPRAHRRRGRPRRLRQRRPGPRLPGRSTRLGQARPAGLLRHRVRRRSRRSTQCSLPCKGSLFVTRPALADYIADPAERAELAGELFGHVGIRPDHDRDQPALRAGGRRHGPPRPGVPAGPSGRRCSARICNQLTHIGGFHDQHG